MEKSLRMWIPTWNSDDSNAYVSLDENSPQYRDGVQAYGSLGSSPVGNHWTEYALTVALRNDAGRKRVVGNVLEFLPGIGGLVFDKDSRGLVQQMLSECGEFHQLKSISALGTAWYWFHPTVVASVMDEENSTFRPIHVGSESLGVDKFVPDRELLANAPAVYYEPNYGEVVYSDRLVAMFHGGTLSGVEFKSVGDTQQPNVSPVNETVPSDREDRIDSMIIEPMGADVTNAITEEVPAAATRLGVSSDASPETIISSIDRLLAGRPRMEDDEIAIMGALLGTQFVRSLGWHWVELNPGSASAAFAVVDADQRLGVQPMNWLYGIVREGRDVNVQLTFDLVRSGTTPDVPGFCVLA